jgi:hypothetical protein
MVSEALGARERGRGRAGRQNRGDAATAALPRQHGEGGATSEARPRQHAEGGATTAARRRPARQRAAHCA